MLATYPCPHLIDMLDYFVNAGRLCTVYPLADSTLWHVYRSRQHGGLWASSRLANYMSGVGLGLAHLHALQVAHGDASLRNMLLMRNDQVAVADFGTAHSAHGFPRVRRNHYALCAQPRALVGSHPGERSARGTYGHGACSFGA